MVSTTLLVLAAAVAAWIITSIPLYLAAKIIAGKKGTFLRAMLASLLGPIFIVITLFIFSILLFPVLLVFSVPVALILALIVLSWVYGAIFDTGIGGGFLIALIAFFINLILLFVFGAIFGTSFALFQPGRHLPVIGSGIP